MKMVQIDQIIKFDKLVLNDGNGYNNNTGKINEPPRGKTNNVVSEQARHKPTCTSTEKS